MSATDPTPFPDLADLPDAVRRQMTLRVTVDTIAEAPIPQEAILNAVKRHLTGRVYCMQVNGWYEIEVRDLVVDDAEKAIAYYRAGAAQSRTHAKPPFVPSRVRLLRQVRGDGPFCATQLGPGEYDCDCNPYGAVSVRATNGQMLGLRLDEFEPIAWRENNGVTVVTTAGRNVP